MPDKTNTPVETSVPPHKPAPVPPAFEGGTLVSEEDDRRARAKPWRRRAIWLAILIVLGIGVYFLWFKNSGAKPSSATSKGTGKAGRGLAAVPVVAAKSYKGNIGVYFTGLGAVTPIYTVTVKSRVDGELMSVQYKEGELVHKGDLLIEIDPRPYQVQLTQAQGQLIKDQALLDNARIDLNRYQTLLGQKAIPGTAAGDPESIEVTVQDEGTVKSDQGQIDSANLNITYSRITSPITGRIGLRLVDPGNIVHAADTNGLLVITQIQPISVIFTISEDQLPVVIKKMAAGQKLEVDAWDHDLKNKLAQGSLTTLDNQIDSTTGTLKLRATFDNTNNSLFPNQFVNARLLVEEKQGVTLTPTAAVQRNPQSTYVYVVKPDSTVTVRTITIGTTEGDVSEVTAGLTPGEVLVMTGVDKLQEGTKVVAQIPGATPAATPAASPSDKSSGHAKKGN